MFVILLAPLYIFTTYLTCIATYLRRLPHLHHYISSPLTSPTSLHVFATYLTCITDA